MSKASPIQQSFNAGEFAPRMEGRTDIEKYANACQELQNFLPLIQGAALKRSGFRYVKHTKDSSKRSRLIPFEFSATQAYALEFGDLYMRVYLNGGISLKASVAITSTDEANPVQVTTGAAHGLVTGEETYLDGIATATSLNEKFYTVTFVDATHYTLDGVDGTGIGLGTGGTSSEVFEVATPYAAADVDALQWSQSADVLYLAHPDHPRQKVERTGHAAWTVTEIVDEWAAFAPENVDEAVTCRTSATTGNVTITGVGTAFTSDMVGGYIKLREVPSANHPEWISLSSGGTWDALVPAGGFSVGDYCFWEENVYQLTNKNAAGDNGNAPPTHELGTKEDVKWSWLYQHSGYGYGLITAVGSSVSMSVTVVKPFPASTVGAGGATHRWSYGAWSAQWGYPRTVSFYEDRLWWGGSSALPQGLWGSRPGRYEDHQARNDGEGALVVVPSSDQQNTIEWISSGDVLLVGTAGAEFAVKPASATEGLSAGNVRAPQQSTIGSRAGVQAIVAGVATLFVQRTGRRMLEVVYSDSTEKYEPVDLNVLADHIALGRIKHTAFQQEPHRIIWCVLDDGQLLGLTYDRPQQVVAWHRHVLGGTDVAVESVCSIPSQTGELDQLWAIVSRTINGATARYVELLEEDWLRTNDAEDAFFVDSGLTYDATPTSTISGLDHLEGETVAVLADGAVHPSKSVSGGVITLDYAASVVQVGLAFEGDLETMRFEAGGRDGTSQGKTKRFTNVVIRLDQTGPGLWFGGDSDTMDEVQMRDPGDPMDAPVPLLDGDTEKLTWPGGYEQAGRLRLEHRTALPCTITAVMPQLNTQDRG